MKKCPQQCGSGSAAQAGRRRKRFEPCVWPSDESSCHVAGLKAFYFNLALAPHTAKQSERHGETTAANDPNTASLTLSHILFQVILSPIHSKMGKKSRRKKNPGASPTPSSTSNERNWPAEGQLGSELRFSIGTQVYCLVDEWRPGRITRLWYRESDWPRDRVAPYQILLDAGGYIYAPKDTDAYIKIMHAFPYMVRANQAKEALESKQYRSAADLYLEAVRLAPDVWTARRYDNFDSYCAALVVCCDDTTKQDVQVLKNFLFSEEEPILFRVTAASTLGEIDQDSSSVAQCLEQGIALCDAAKPADKRKRIMVDDNIRTGGDILMQCKESMSERLDEVLEKTNSNLAELLEESALPYEQRLVLAEEKCDCCDKTIEDLGVDKLEESCNRCQQAFYCSVDCKTKQWKVGHSKSCRGSNTILNGDVMIIKGLTGKPIFNNALVLVIGPDTGNEGRWKVKVVGGTDCTGMQVKNRVISVAAEKLHHTRPAM